MKNIPTFVLLTGHRERASRHARQSEPTIHQEALAPLSSPSSVLPHPQTQADSRTLTRKQLLVGSSMHLKTLLSLFPPHSRADGQAGLARPSQVPLSTQHTRACWPPSLQSKTHAVAPTPPQNCAPRSSCC